MAIDDSVKTDGNCTVLLVVGPNMVVAHVDRWQQCFTKRAGKSVERGGSSYENTGGEDEGSVKRQGGESAQLMCCHDSNHFVTINEWL